MEVCENCQGTGIDPDSRKTCPDCDGVTVYIKDPVPKDE